MAKSQPKIQITKNFNVSAEKVYDAWLDPEMIGRWMFGPELRDEEIIKLQTNPEAGGTFSFVVNRGGEELDHKGTYRKVDRPNQLVFTWGVNEEAGSESVVSITIESTGSGCRLTLVHEFDPKWAKYADRTKEGWSTMLTKLKELLNKSLNNHNRS